MKPLVLFAALIFQGALTGAAAAEPARTSRSASPSPFMRVYGATPPPFGFVSSSE